MKATRLFFAAALFAAGFAQASEISEFPVPASTLSRTDVRTEAQAANKAGQLRYDFVGPVATMPQPMSMKSRDEVRKEAMARMSKGDLSAAYFVGGN